MSPRTFVTRGATLFVLATLGLAACKSETVVPPPPPDVVVTVSPSTATLTKAGTSVQYVALVQGVGTNGNTAVTWKSSDATIASVAASGNTATVTAVKSGTATIIATSVQDPTRSGAATVVVNIPTDTTHPPAQPSVSIQSITDNSGKTVDNGNIQGLINVALNVDVPVGNVISSVNWLVDGKTVCSQTFTQGKSAGSVTVQAADAVTMTCQINTAQLTNGVPTFANGAHTLSATLVGPGGTTQASTSQSLVFNNQNQIGATVTTTKNAIGPNGFVWNGGNLTVTSTPVIFTGSPIARVTFTAKLLGKDTLSAPVVDTTVADGFIATFRGDTAGGFLFNVTDSVVVFISTVTAAGTQGPMDTVVVGRFDNQAPDSSVAAGGTMGAAPASGWIGNVTLKNSTFGFKAVDAGVNTVKYTIQARDTGATTFNTVVKATDIGNKAAASEQFRIQACDALNNCLTSATFTVGVDVEAPVVTFDASNTVADTAKFTAVAAANHYVIGFQDFGPSGFSTTTPVQVIEIAKVKADSSICVVGSKTNTFCDTPASFDSNVPVDGVAGTQEGYVTMTAFVVDRAGNQSNVLTRQVLVDYHAPVADSVVAGTLTGGQSGTFTAFMHDNVSLASATSRLAFLPAAADSVLFDMGKVSFGGFGTFTFSGTGAYTTPFFIKAAEWAGATGVVATSFFGPSGVRVKPTDVAGNAGVDSLFGIFSAFTAPSSDPFAGDSVVTAADSSSAVLSATLTVKHASSATTSPAAQVRFYSVTAAGVATLVGAVTNPVITVNTADSTATFTFTGTPSTTLKSANKILGVYTTSSGIAVFQKAAITP